MSRMRIAGIQHDVVWNNRDANFERLAPQVAAAAGAGADLILLAEMFSTGFGFADPAFESEPEGGPSSQFLTALAAEHGAWVGGSCPELDPSAPDDQRPTNSFVLAGPDGTTYRYRKIHPFSYAGEHNFVRPGDQLMTVDVNGFRVSMFVCYDLRFADEFWQLALDTDLYLVPAAWPEKRRAHWMALLQARAIENQAYVLGVNRVGTSNGEGGTLYYSGDSRIIDPLGELLATASHTESIVLADISTEQVVSTRDQFRFLPDRR